MRDKVIQWRVAVSGKNCLQKEEKVERKWVSASDNLTSTFLLIIAAFMDPICCRKENSFPFWGDMYSKLDCTWDYGCIIVHVIMAANCTWDYSCLLNCAQNYGWKLWLKVMAKRNYDCLHNCNSGVMIQSWFANFSSLHQPSKQRTKTNACFSLKKQTNKYLFQS